MTATQPALTDAIDRIRLLGVDRVNGATFGIHGAAHHVVAFRCGDLRRAVGVRTDTPDAADALVSAAREWIEANAESCS